MCVNATPVIDSTVTSPTYAKIKIRSDTSTFDKSASSSPLWAACGGYRQVQILPVDAHLIEDRVPVDRVHNYVAVPGLRATARGARRAQASPDIAPFRHPPDMILTRRARFSAASPSLMIPIERTRAAINAAGPQIQSPRATMRRRQLSSPQQPSWC